MSRTLLALVGAAALIALVTSAVVLRGPGGGASPRAGAAAVSEPAPPPSARPSCAPGTVVPLDGSSSALAVVAERALVARRAPDGAVIARFGRRNVNGVRTVFGVVAARVDARCVRRWYRVQLPIRPNGTLGWVRAADVGWYRVDTRVLVDLSQRSLTVFRGGRAIFRTRAAVGKPATPTPQGRFYVNQRLLAADPTGPYGPGGVGISAFSPVLVHWTQGGPIAIHGTNHPELIGGEVSNGCVRVRNDDLRRLLRLAPEGTPVVVRS